MGTSLGDIADVAEIKNDPARRAELVKEYIELSPAEADATLTVSDTNEARREINSRAAIASSRRAVIATRNESVRQHAKSRGRSDGGPRQLASTPTPRYCRRAECGRAMTSPIRTKPVIRATFYAAAQSAASVPSDSILRLLRRFSATAGGSIEGSLFDNSPVSGCQNQSPSICCIRIGRRMEASRRAL